MKSEPGNKGDLCYRGNMSGVGFWLAEMVGLISDAKRMAALEISNMKDIDRFKKVLRSHAPDKDFKFLKTPPFNWIKKVNPNYKCSLFVGKEKSDLIEFRKLYRDPWKVETNLKIAKFLSYPECCAKEHYSNPKSFREYFKTGVANQIDYRINNFYLRSPSNAKIIRHYVCNYDCEKSIRYAEEVLEFLKENLPEIYNFYEQVLKFPLLVIFPDDSPTRRLVGDGTVLTFQGHYDDGKTLVYSRVYDFIKEQGPRRYDNEEESKEICKKILKGNKIKLKNGGIDIYSNDELKETVENDRLVFIEPKEF